MRPINNVKDVKCSAFGDCGPKLKWLLIDNILEITGEGEFTDYVSPWYAFRTIIEYVRIDSGVTSVGEYAFYNCTALKSINIPDTVTRIGGYAFYSCYSLKSISIGNNVVEIGEKVFEDCPDLTVICKKGSYADGYLADKDLKLIYN